MIPGICPSCGAQFDLETALADAEARQALAAALDVPPALAKALIRYLALQAPGGKRLAWPRLSRLLRELTELLAAGTVTHRGQTLAAPTAVWAAALEEVLSARDKGTLTLPLDGHGFLRAVAFGLAGRPAQEVTPAPSGRPAAHTPAQLPRLPRRSAGAPAPEGLKSLRDVLHDLRKPTDDPT